MSARCIVGIDLGTTNSVLAHLDWGEAEEPGPIRVLGIPQLTDPGEVTEQPYLPSFLYLPGESEFPPGSLALPWEREVSQVVGELARKRGAENPLRLVASAKSWLCHAGAERRAPILPWGSPEEVPKLSPVEASARYLAYLRRAWEARPPGSPPDCRLAEQDVFLTVPASFDEEAREMTLEAAQEAGLPRVTLLEEPQAAFYAWLDSQGERWRKQVAVGDLVLVCDVGGGTTDFSLIAVSEEGGELVLKRVAVGDHILLGGDNMDLALAHLLRQRLEAEGHRIDTWQLHALWHQCRLAKEALLGDTRRQKQSIALLGAGTRLVGGTIKTELRREDVGATLLDGFFPQAASRDMPARQRRVGFQELGLPYAADPAITRHLARFLAHQAQDRADAAPIRRGPSGLACPTHLLFNGGVMKAAALRGRLSETLDAWLREEGFPPARLLTTPDPAQAVARGAVYYGRARRGRGVRIRSGAPRTYYIGIESAMPAVPGRRAPLKALCVVPFGMEEGSEAKIADREFGLVVGESAEFRLLSSTLRKRDPIGSLIEDWGEELQELTPLEVTLALPGREESVVPVRLETRVTEVGTLELWCVSRDGEQRWKLQFNIRERDDT